MQPLREALDRAAALGRTVEFWWRDDDAVRHTPELDRLLEFARQFASPLALAAIPNLIEPSLGARLASEPDVRVLAHGFRHRNHAPAGEKRAEFGAHRQLDDLVRDGRQALAELRAAFGPTALDVFVPPWNRIAASFEANLAGLGYGGLSTFGPRRTVPGVAVINTHLDPVDWGGTRSAVEPSRLGSALARALGSCDLTGEPEPIGLLTHHLVFDESLWTATAAVLETMRAHPAVRFVPLAELWRAKTVIELCPV